MPVDCSRPHAPREVVPGRCRPPPRRGNMIRPGAPDVPGAGEFTSPRVASRGGRSALAAALRLGLLAGAGHLDVEPGSVERAGGDLAAAPGQRDRRILAARRLDQADAL